MPPVSPPAPAVRYCTTPDGVRIAFEQLGSGPPIVKSSNWMSHLGEDRDTPVWRHWLDMLTDGRRLTRFDGRGFGMSEREPAEVNFEGTVTDMEAVVDAAGLDRFPVLGFSNGGAIAMAYAARHPERVSALVLCGAYAQGRAVRDTSPAGAAERELLLRMIELGWGQDTPAYRQVFATRAMPDGPNDALAAACAIQRASATAEQAMRQTTLFWHVDVTALLPRLRCPVLVLHARRDEVVPFSQGQLLAQRIAGASFVPLDSANHDLIAEEPAWAVLRSAVTAFLAEHAGAPVRRDGRDVGELTAREREVLHHIARGLDNQEIGDTLFMSEKTVRNHVTAIFSKLGFTSRGRLIVWARDAGLGREQA